MSPVTDPAAGLRQRLVDHLTAAGALRSPQWRAAFAAVPREEFVASGFSTSAPGRAGQTRHAPGDHDFLKIAYSDDSPDHPLGSLGSCHQ